MTRELIPLTLKMETVDMKTGEATPGTAAAFMMPAREGTCPFCATAHNPDEPHNAQSLFYQMRFHAERGRYPDWRDAMAHCEPDVKKVWTEGLVAMNVDVEGGAINPGKRK